MSALALSLTPVLSACSWPDYTQGGMDEAYQYNRQEIIPASLEDNERAADWAKRLDECRGKIDRLTTGAGKIWRPALLQQAEVQWSRAARVFRAGYAPDIETDLVRLEEILRQLVAEVDDEQGILAYQESQEILHLATGEPEQDSSPEQLKAGVQTSGKPAANEREADTGSPLKVTVNPGNSLWRISRRFQGQGRMYPKIVAANKGKIHHPDLIYPGQVFVIPEPSK